MHTLIVRQVFTCNETIVLILVDETMVCIDEKVNCHKYINCSSSLVLCKFRELTYYTPTCCLVQRVLMTSRNMQFFLPLSFYNSIICLVCVFFVRCNKQ